MTESELVDFATRYAAAWSGQKPEELAAGNPHENRSRISIKPQKSDYGADDGRRHNHDKMIPRLIQPDIGQVPDAYKNQQGKS